MSRAATASEHRAVQPKDVYLGVICGLPIQGQNPVFAPNQLAQPPHNDTAVESGLVRASLQVVKSRIPPSKLTVANPTSSFATVQTRFAFAPTLTIASSALARCAPPIAVSCDR